MRNIITIGWALLNRNRKLNVFIGLILMICLTGLISALSIMFTTNGLFEKFTNEHKSAHVIRIMDTRHADVEAIKNYLNTDERIESYQMQFSTDTVSRVQINEYDDIMAVLIEHPTKPVHDFVRVIKGKQSSMPGLNEAWIPTGLAYKYKLKVGDILQLKGVDGKENYMISAIVFDPLFASSMVQPSRIWVRSGQLSMMKGLGDSGFRTMTFRLKDIHQIKAVLADFDNAFPTLSYGLNVDNGVFKSMANLLNDIISSALLATSILLLIISSAIIYFIVSGEIINEYTVFGIYKGLGFSMSQIKNFNRTKYVLLVIMVTPLSMLFSFGTSRLVLSIYEKMAGVDALMPKIVLPTVISLVLMLAIIAMTIQMASRKLNRMKPAQAIRFGYQAKKKYKKVTKPSTLSPVYALGLKEMGLYPMRTGIKILTITGLAILIFTVNIVTSSMNKVFTTDLTVGIPSGDLFIQKNATLGGRSVADIMEDLQSTEGVETVIPAIMSFNNSTTNEGERISLMGFGYDDYKDLALSVIEGKNPQNSNEAAITKTLAKKIGKGIGDMITLNVDGSNETFLICGTFQIMSNQGMAFRITTVAYKKVSPLSDYSWFAAIAKPGENLVTLKDRLVSRFGGELTITIFEEFVEEIVGSITSSTTLISYVLVAIMAMICGLALYNMIWLQMLENKKYYGLMKAVGMSISELTRIQLFKMAIMTTIGVTVGFVASTLFVPHLLKSMLSSTGVDRIQSVQSPIWILGVALLMYAITLSSTAFAAINQSKVKLKSLIME